MLEPSHRLLLPLLLGAALLFGAAAPLVQAACMLAMAPAPVEAMAGMNHGERPPCGETPDEQDDACCLLDEASVSEAAQTAQRLHAPAPPSAPLVTAPRSFVTPAPPFAAAIPPVPPARAASPQALLSTFLI